MELSDSLSGRAGRVTRVEDSAAAVRACNGAELARGEAEQFAGKASA